MAEQPRVCPGCGSLLELDDKPYLTWYWRVYCPNKCGWSPGLPTEERSA